MKIAILFFIMIFTSMTLAQTSDDDWPTITRESKPWTRWWWLGSAVDRENLSRELQTFADAGIGGVEITPLYGVSGAESREIDFLSPKWIEMLQHVSAESKRLDLGVDMATGTGWPFGGPQVSEQFADTSMALVDGQIVARPTRMKVKRAAPGAEGLVVDPFSVAAIENYLKPFGALPRDIVRGQFHDSFEYRGNYSRDLPAKFRGMHGYDLQGHAAEIFGTGDPETIARVKSDYRDTLAAMHLDYIRKWVSWTHSRGEIARSQAHGSPGNLLDLYAAADIPETESFGATHFEIPNLRIEPAFIDQEHHSNLLFSKFASSAAHLTGKKFASAESLTWLREHFQLSLAMAKPELDQLFLAGINHIFYHGTCYSPGDAAWPGWQFYAACEINPRNPIWRDLPAMNQYVARCQAVLQAGIPANDLLVYWPIYDAWNSAEGMDMRFTAERAHHWLQDSEFGKTCDDLAGNGITFDYVSDAQLLDCNFEKAQFRSEIKTAGGSCYERLIVPPTNVMPLETLDAILRLARSGATVEFVKNLPRQTPGLGNVEQRRKFDSLLASLKFSDTDREGVRAMKYGSGKVILTEDAVSPMLAENITSNLLGPRQVQFIRRAWQGGSYFFLANLSDKPVDEFYIIAEPIRGAELMDPLTGRCGKATVNTKILPEFRVQLDPGESLLVKTLCDRESKLPDWKYRPDPRLPLDALELKGPWHVEFIDGGPQLPAAIDMQTLASWTDQDDPRTQNFAGTARYRIEFDRPKTGDEWILDFGDVRESARVKLNGKEVGTAWSLPMRVRLGELAEHNELTIDVTNLAANRIRDLDQRGLKWKIFKDINFVDIRYRPFDASNWPVAKSGLLGPVRLVRE